MITKNTILITSIGRTGTEFFSKFFSDIIPNCTSLHEPDIIKNPRLENDKRNYLKQIQYAGIWRLIFLKIFKKWTIVRLSDARFLGRIDFHQTVQKLYDQRNSFISQLPGSVYVESNLGYYGLLDVTPAVFQNHKAIYLVRDGRDWVRSTYNWGEAYGKNGIRKLFEHVWPTASQINGDPFAEQWDNLSRFEQLCWAWSKLNSYALNTMQTNPNARMFKFEDIFKSKDKYDVLNDLVSFTTSLPGLSTEKIKKTDGWLEQRIHQSSSKLQAWDTWSEDQRNQFNKICGPLMEDLEYKI